jgi:hypothetical protein
MTTLYIAFRRNLSERVLKELKVTNQFTITSSLSGIISALNYVVKNKFDSVVALGVYYGRDQDKVRIETHCGNKFRNNIILGVTKTNLSKQVIPNEKSKYAKGLGNSLCNLLSAKILNHPELQNVDYSFIHIPKKFSTLGASAVVKVLCSHLS